MTIEKLRYSMTEHKESIFDYRNYKLLIHPEIDNNDLINKLVDDFKLIPKIESTYDKTDIKFYSYDYNQNIYSKNELLVFIFASINSDWNIIKGLDIINVRFHYYLKNGNIIFDPSLSIITTTDVYSKNYKDLKEIKNENILKYAKKHNNLYKFYQKNIIKRFNKNNFDFSINFINKIIKEFNDNINEQYILNEECIKRIKEFITEDNFLIFRQVLTKKRTYILKSNKISVHPSIDDSILDIINNDSKNISNLMKKEYDMDIDYYNGTIGCCYELSILYNLYNKDFKLVQGGIPFIKHGTIRDIKSLYQHSWLEKDNIIYDPAFRMVVPKDLYYIFVKKQDIYSKEDTENILRRIGFNLTHFRDFINGVQIGNDETLAYRFLVKEIDYPKMKEEGEKLISTIKTLKKTID